MQQALTQQTAFTPIATEQNQLIASAKEPSIQEKQQDIENETFTLDFDL